MHDWTNIGRQSNYQICLDQMLVNSNFFLQYFIGPNASIRISLNEIRQFVNHFHYETNQALFSKYSFKLEILNFCYCGSIFFLLKVNIYCQVSNDSSLTTQHQHGIQKTLRIFTQTILILKNYPCIYKHLIKNKLTKKMSSLKSIELGSRTSIDYEEDQDNLSMVNTPKSLSKISSLKNDNFQEQVMNWFNTQGIQMGNPEDIRDAYEGQQRKLITGSSLTLDFPDHLLNKKSKK